MRSSDPVRVSIPVNVASDIKSFKKAVGGILDKLGCQACCSGHDILFDLQRNFAFDDNLKVSGFSSRSVAKSDAAQSFAVTASLSPKASNDIKSVYASIDKIAELLGCPACCSGHDLRFDLERSFIVDEKLNIHEQTFALG